MKGNRKYKQPLTVFAISVVIEEKVAKGTRIVGGYEARSLGTVHNTAPKPAVKSRCNWFPPVLLLKPNE